MARMLVVDDEEEICEFLEDFFCDKGYEVYTAPTGDVALAIVADKKPDLLLLDIMMSTDTEGFDLAYELKNSPGFENLPIIILTSFLERVRAEGPDQFQHILGEAWPAKWMFEKPVDSEKLLQKIESILKGRRSPGA